MPFPIAPSLLPLIVFRPCDRLEFNVGVPALGDGVVCLELLESFPEKTDRNRDVAGCFCLRLKDTMSPLSASRGSSERTVWSLEWFATGSSLSLSSSIAAGLGGLRLDEDDEASSSVCRYWPADPLAILIHLLVDFA